MPFPYYRTLKIPTTSENGEYQSIEEIFEEAPEDEVEVPLDPHEEKLKVHFNWNISVGLISNSGLFLEFLMEVYLIF